MEPVYSLLTGSCLSAVSWTR